MVVIVAADTATDYSTEHPKMTPVADFAAALDCVAIDPLVVLPGERWISLHLNWAGVANCSTRRALMDSIAVELDSVRNYY